jgi:predicted RNA binding protein YcfA (HicA-like mRNA interferase family)
MASALPILSGRAVARGFESFGWNIVRQTGSHIILVKEGEFFAIIDYRCRKIPQKR